MMDALTWCCMWANRSMFFSIPAPPFSPPPTNSKERGEAMADSSNDLEQQIETIINARFAQEPAEQEETTIQDDTEERQVIDVDLYRLHDGAVLLVPKHATNPLDAQS